MADVIVAGGGIGGLSSALALTARGHRAVVLERADEFAEIGAGIQIAANGLHALDVLGVGDAVRASAVRMAELRFMDGVTGEHVVSLDLTEPYQRRFGNPYVVVHRAHLHTALLDACRASGRVELISGVTVTGYDQDAASASAVLADGTTITGDALIGADGINSAIRRQLVGDGDPRVSGILVYRSIIPMAEVPAAVRFPRSVVWWAGPGCHFVHYPIAGGRYLNLAASFDHGATEAISGVPVSKESVRELFDVLGDTAGVLLDIGEDWRSWMLVDRPPVPGWTDGRVALLGDAAHPMLHYAAQGACQAIEDAVVLAALFDGRDVPGQLAAYTEARRERTARVQQLSRQSTRLWHPAGAKGKERNEMLAAMSPTELHDYVAWMHGVQVPGPGLRHGVAV